MIINDQFFNYLETVAHAKPYKLDQIPRSYIRQIGEREYILAAYKEGKTQDKGIAYTRIEYPQNATQEKIKKVYKVAEEKVIEDYKKL